MTLRYLCNSCGAEAAGAAAILGWVEVRALGPATPHYRAETSHLCRLCWAGVQHLVAVQHSPGPAEGGVPELSEHSQSRDMVQ